MFLSAQRLWSELLSLLSLYRCLLSSQFAPQWLWSELLFLFLSRALGSSEDRWAEGQGLRWVRRVRLWSELLINEMEDDISSTILNIVAKNVMGLQGVD